VSKASDALAATYGLAAPNRITEGITHRQLAVILREASNEAEQLTLFFADTNMIRAAQYQQITAGLESLSAQMWVGTGKITTAGEYAMAELAADQVLDLDLLSGVPPHAIEQYVQLTSWQARTTVDSIISRRTNGYTLAERIYANGKVSTKQVGRIVEKGLAQQVSAKELAGRVRGFYRPDVPGGASYAAMRLARTEINNAHHHTAMRLTQDKPWVTGYKWNLSSSHPKPDPCDRLAHHDEGLGEGVFAKTNQPDRPHPQCLCYVTHMYVDDDVLVNNIATGAYDDYFDSMGVQC
jgi:hypothetical protein